MLIGGMTFARTGRVCMAAGALLGLLTLGPPAGCAQAAKPVRAGKYQPLKPYEDFTNAERATEIFDQALSAYQANKYDEAEKLFRRVLELDHKNADAYFNLGAIAEWHNDLPGALKFYRQALALRPQDPELKTAITEVESKVKDRSLARQREADNRRTSNLAMAGQQAKEAFAAGDYHESARQLYQLAKTFPKEAKIQFALGQSLRATKNYAWSAYHLKMAIFLDPENDEYRKAIVELDEEVQKAQEQALLDTARVALVHVKPFVGGEVIDLGL